MPWRSRRRAAPDESANQTKGAGDGFGAPLPSDERYPSDLLRAHMDRWLDDITAEAWIVRGAFNPDLLCVSLRAALRAIEMTTECEPPYGAGHWRVTDPRWRFEVANKVCWGDGIGDFQWPVDEQYDLWLYDGPFDINVDRSYGYWWIGRSTRQRIVPVG